MIFMNSSSLKVFDISGAPSDEVENIRKILEKNEISYYETPRANFGVSTAAIWVDKKEYENARKLIDFYQNERIRKTRNIRKTKDTDIKWWWWIRVEVLFSIFVIILLVWMMFAGLTRP